MASKLIKFHGDAREITVEGPQIDGGCRSPYFISDPEKQRVALDHVFVLIHEKPRGLQKAASIASLILTTDCVIAAKAKPAMMAAGGASDYGR